MRRLATTKATPALKERVVIQEARRKAGTSTQQEVAAGIWNQTPALCLGVSPLSTFRLRMVVCRFAGL
jgi:hypothetical protein